MNTSVQEPPSKQELKFQSELTAQPPATHTHSWRHFARHYLEMAVVMGIGMFAAAFVFMTSLNLAVEGDVTWEQALLDYPAHALLAVAIGMSLPMIPWMRRRGHSRRSAYEMAVVMAALAIPFVCLALFDVVEGAQCGLYCAVGFVAMLALMLYRRDEYAGHPTPGDV